LFAKCASMTNDIVQKLDQSHPGMLGLWNINDQVILILDNKWILEIQQSTLIGIF